MSEKIMAHRMTVEVSQGGNTEGTTAITETMTIEVEALWIDSESDGFVVIRTEGWSVDSSSEIAQIVDAAQDAARMLNEKIASISVRTSPSEDK